MVSFPNVLLEVQGIIIIPAFFTTVLLLTHSVLRPLLVLFISYKFVKGFWDNNFCIICYFLAENFIMCVNVLQPETKFQLDPTRNEKFPHRPPL